MKNIMILGDSYSTFEGHIPEGYEPYYFKGGQDGPDVTKVEETWWHQFVEETGVNLVLNDSWSGSPICYRGYNEKDCSESSSFIYRFERLVKDGFFEQNEIDTLFIFGGTNDDYIGVELGEDCYEEVEKERLFTVFPAICTISRRAREVLPNAQIYHVLNTGFKEEIYSCFKRAGERYNIKVIMLEGIDKIWGHPTVKGMKQIKEQVLSNL